MKPHNMDWLNTQQRTMPHAPALHGESRSWTYKELHQSVIELAGSMKKLTGIQERDIVAVYLPNSAEYVVLIHAIRWLGCTLLPLHITAKERELASILRRVNPALQITDAEHAPNLGASVTESDSRVFFIDDLLREHGEIIEKPAISPQIVTILCTSGSMGESKLVPHHITQHEASAFASSANMSVKIEDNWLCCLPLSHAGGLSIVFRSMIYGSSMTILRRFNPREVIRKIRGHEATYISLVPTMLRELLALAEFSPEHLPSLKTILLGGARPEMDILNEAANRGFRALTTYGMTETCSQIATLNDGAGPEKRGSAGRPLQSVQIAIRNDEGSELPRGESGAIWVKGPMVTKGYFGAESDGERFMEGWFKTGDAGRIDAEGYLWVERRSDNIIITGGENVDPAEVEAVLRAFPGITEAVVIGLPDARWGEVVAAALEVPTGAIDLPEVVAHCRKKLAAYNVPKKWLVLQTLPRTGPGKLARAELKGFEFVEG